MSRYIPPQTINLGFWNTR